VNAVLRKRWWGVIVNLSYIDSMKEIGGNWNSVLAQTRGGNRTDICVEFREDLSIMQITSKQPY